MTLGMDHVIVVIKGDITDKKLLKKLRVDAIVNAANPTIRAWMELSTRSCRN